MRLEPLCDMVFRYSEPIDMLFAFGGREGQGYGGGDGTVEGERLRGMFKWSNWPRVREDGMTLPDLNGIIKTDSGAKILFRTDGYSILKPDQKRRAVVGGTMFISDHDDFRWINSVYAIQEGAIDLETGVVHVRLHECIPEG